MWIYSFVGTNGKNYLARAVCMHLLLLDKTKTAKRAAKHLFGIEWMLACQLPNLGIRIHHDRG